MADRHENNWQPVRPLDDDPPDDRDPEPAVAAETTPVSDAKPAVQREPFRSTPITIPPESVDNLPVAPHEATPTSGPPPVSVDPAVVSKDSSEPTDIGGEAASGTDAAADGPDEVTDSNGVAVLADSAAVLVDEVDRATANGTSTKTPIASAEQATPALHNTVAPSPEAKPI